MASAAFSRNPLFAESLVGMLLLENLFFVGRSADAGSSWKVGRNFYPKSSCGALHFESSGEFPKSFLSFSETLSDFRPLLIQKTYKSLYSPRLIRKRQDYLFRQASWILTTGAKRQNNLCSENCFGRFSDRFQPAKLPWNGIFDSVVEVSLEGAIRLKEALPIKCGGG